LTASPEPMGRRDIRSGSKTPAGARHTRHPAEPSRCGDGPNSRQWHGPDPNGWPIVAALALVARHATAWALEGLRRSFQPTACHRLVQVGLEEDGSHLAPTVPFEGCLRALRCSGGNRVNLSCERTTPYSRSGGNRARASYGSQNRIDETQAPRPIAHSCLSSS